MGIESQSALKVSGTDLIVSSAMVSGGVAVTSAQTVTFTIKRISDNFYWNGSAWANISEPSGTSASQVGSTGIYEYVLTGGFLATNLSYVIHIVATNTLAFNFYFTEVVTETEVTNSLKEHNLDHLLKTPVANNADMTVEVPDGTVISNMLSKTSNTSSYTVLTDALEAIGDVNDPQAIWDVLESAVVVAGSMGLKLKQVLEATTIATVGTGTHTTTLIASSNIVSLATTDALKFRVVNFTAGNLKGRAAPITTFNKTTGEIGIDAAFPFPVIPVSGDIFTVT